MNNLTLGRKIALGFGVLIMISAGLGIMGSWQMKQAKSGSELLAFEYVPEMQISARVRSSANRTMYQMRGYGFSEEEKYYQNAVAELAALEERLGNAEELAQKAEHLVKLPVQLGTINKEVDNYKKLVESTREAIGGLSKAREGLDSNAAQFMKEANAYLVNQNKKIREQIAEGQPAERLVDRVEKISLINDVIDLGNDTRVKVFKAQATRDPALLEDARNNFPKMATALQGISKNTAQQVNLAQLAKIQDAADGYSGSMTMFLDNWKKLQDLGVQREESGNVVIEACRDLQNAAIDATIEISTESAGKLATATTSTIVGLIVALVVGVLLAFFMIRSITGPINRVIAGMQAGSEQVASAAGQVSASSQQLAEGASEQASSLEETSASLEMMSSGAKQSADNSRRANTRSQEVKSNAEKGQAAMQGLNSAMEKIKNSSDETAKIIKTIDEIAFQTNLLALNAAVEAARAGDAGKGFAVVAEEVRNLAQRSAEAAKGTADLIDGAKQNSDLGVQATAEVSSILEDVVGGIVEVSALINDLSSTAEDQARSVGEVNTAVSQMDTVTQANAAGAEESASAAEEMSAQAGEMQSLVKELIKIVGSAGAATHTATHSVLGHHGPSAKRGGRPAANHFGSARPQAGRSRLDEVIPLDEDSLIEI